MSLCIPLNLLHHLWLHQSGGTFLHQGIQVESDEELNELSDRMRESGQPFLDVEKTTCCYAKMEKSWVKGPNEEKWEAFITHSHDAEEYGEDREHLLASM